jgi:hypothetical protein
MLFSSWFLDKRTKKAEENTTMLRTMTKQTRKIYYPTNRVSWTDIKLKDTFETPIKLSGKGFNRKPFTHQTAFGTINPKKIEAWLK